MRFVMRLGRPIFVENKFRRVVQRDVQIVIQTTGVLSRRRDQSGQNFPQFRFLAGTRLKGDDESKSFHILFLNHGLTQMDTDKNKSFADNFCFPFHPCLSVSIRGYAIDSKIFSAAARGFSTP